MLEETTPVLAVAANFTAEPLEDSLRFWINFHEWNYRVSFAPFDQVFQQLLAPDSLLGSNRHGVNLILLRFDSWLTIPTAADQQIADENLECLISALKHAADRTSASWILCLCPASPNAHSSAREWVSAASRRLNGELASVAGFGVIIGDDVLTSYPVDQFEDIHADAVAAVPYTAEVTRR